MTLKICLIGPPQSGKTRYAQSIGAERDDEITKQLFPDVLYKPTLGVNIDIIKYQEKDIALWDIGSTHLGVGDSYTTGADGILLFHDHDNNSPPFDLETSIPIVHVFPDQLEDPMQELLCIIDAGMIDA